MTDDLWLAKADEAIALAKQCQAAGDTVGSIAAAVVAAQCLQISKNLGKARTYLAGSETRRANSAGEKP